MGGRLLGDQLPPGVAAQPQPNTRWLSSACVALGILGVIEIILCFVYITPYTEVLRAQLVKFTPDAISNETDLLFGSIPMETGAQISVAVAGLTTLGVAYCGYAGARNLNRLMIGVVSIYSFIFFLFSAATVAGVALQFSFMVFGLASSTGEELGTCPESIAARAMANSGEEAKDKLCKQVIEFGNVAFGDLCMRIGVSLWGTAAGFYLFQHKYFFPRQW